MVPSVSSSPQPRLRIFLEALLDDEEECEVSHPVASLSFRYGQHLVRPEGDPCDGEPPVGRDREFEAEAQRLLESLGAVELACVPSLTPPHDSTADYLLSASANVHAWCAFGSVAVPRLRRSGWDVTFADDYPYQVQEGGRWYAELLPVDEPTPGDWFSLELGIDVDGGRVNLLPALLELLDQAQEEQTLETLLRTPTRALAVPLGANRWITLPPARLRALLGILLELYRGEGSSRGRLRLKAAQAPAMARLESALQPVLPMLWSDPHELRRRGAALEAVPAPDTARCQGLRATLRPYQSQGVAWLQLLREQGLGGVLADDMGLGKTLQTIALLASEKAARRMERPSLVVVPTSLVGNWQRELAAFAPHLSVAIHTGGRRHQRWEQALEANVLLTTYPLLVRDVERFEPVQWHYVILDEAQTIKNPRSLASKAARCLHAAHRLCLSGTPVENHLEELWALFDFVEPLLLGDQASFARHFRVPIERQGSDERLQILRQRVSPLILRRMKEQVAADLPPKTRILRPVELEGAQRELYESIRLAAHADVRHAIRTKGLAASGIAVLDALMKLRQVCCDPRLVQVPAARQVESSAKFAVLLELLELQRERGRAVLVFSQFTRMLALISEALTERQRPHALLTGATVDRQRQIDRFQSGEVDVFLISLKAGGTGLNLVRAESVIHYDPWWNAAAQAQATDRAYRIGQTRPVFVYDLIVSGSVEDRMLGLQRHKQRLAEGLFSGAAPSFDLQELEDLFAPLAE